MKETEKFPCTENFKGWLKVMDWGDGSSPAIEVYSNEDRTSNVCCPDKEDLGKIIKALKSAYESMD